MDTIKQALSSVTQHTFRSVLTLLGIVWGIVAVTLLMAYGDGFGETLSRAFEAFGRDAVICWPGQTSEQAGGGRPGRRVRFEVQDGEGIQQDCPMVRLVSPELLRRAGIVTCG